MTAAPATPIGRSAIRAGFPGVVWCPTEPACSLSGRGGLAQLSASAASPRRGTSVCRSRELDRRQRRSQLIRDGGQDLRGRGGILDRDQYHFSEMVIEDVPAEPHAYAQPLRPLLDQVANAAGRPKSPGSRKLAAPSPCLMEGTRCCRALPEIEKRSIFNAQRPAESRSTRHVEEVYRRQERRPV